MIGQRHRGLNNKVCGFVLDSLTRSSFGHGRELQVVWKETLPSCHNKSEFVPQAAEP